MKSSPLSGSALKARSPRVWRRPSLLSPLKSLTARRVKLPISEQRLIGLEKLPSRLEGMTSMPPGGSDNRDSGFKAAVWGTGQQAADPGTGDQVKAPRFDSVKWCESERGIRESHFPMY